MRIDLFLAANGNDKGKLRVGQGAKYRILWPQLINEVEFLCMALRYDMEKREE